jgi:hypothetical protein
MIIKGKPRSAPEQLADYLLRSDEDATVLELQYGDGDLKKAFIDWDAAGAATRGEKTLYHAQIAWETKYHLNKEQCLRAVQMFAEDMGLANHPRAVVLHGGKGRPHLHVVFMRTDTETMTMWDDGRNYLKHEKASLRMELEFGMEIIPGKHAKRDRKKQPEFPRAAMTSDEAELAKRNGVDLKKLKAELAAMKAASDGAEAFRAAIESAGFVLAKGDRGYTLVDEDGTPFNLARQLKMKTKEVNAYMASVALDTLPTVEQAQALQKQHALAKQDAHRAETVSKSDAPEHAQKQPQEKGVEASKFLMDQIPQEPAEPAHSQEKAISGPDREDRKPEPIDPERKQQITALRAWSDGAQAFKHALEEAGYTLARGRTGYVLVSEEGVFNLARHAGMRKAQFEAFMSPVPLDSLPDAKEFIEAQKQASLESKFLGPIVEAPQPSLLPAKDIDLGTRMDISALDMAAEAIAEAQRAREQSDLEALKKSIAKRHQEEAAVLRERHEAELRVKEVEMDRETKRYMENYLRIQDEQTEAFLKARKENRTGIRGIMDAIENRWNPTLAADKARAREQERQNFYRRLAKERADYEVLLQQNKQLEIENVIARQRLQLEEFRNRAEEEQDRYIREHHEAKRLLAEIEQERIKEEEQLERDDSLRDGPPPPKLGK